MIKVSEIKEKILSNLEEVKKNHPEITVVYRDGEIKMDARNIDKKKITEELLKNIRHDIDHCGFYTEFNSYNKNRYNGNEKVIFLGIYSYGPSNVSFHLTTTYNIDSDFSIIKEHNGAVYYTSPYGRLQEMETFIKRLKVRKLNNLLAHYLINEKIDKTDKLNLLYKILE